jgi:nickel/cobalt exporter
MNSALLPSIIATGFGVAFLHAAIPTHWLPFVLAGRGQHWGHGKTLAVTTVAGLGHIAFTIVLGILVVWLGIETSRLTGEVFPFLAGGVLFLFGLYYLARYARDGGHGHHHWFGHGHGHGDDQSHEHAGHRHPHSRRSAHRESDRAVILGLFAALTFSPCEGFLPIYLSGISYGWQGFLVLSAVLALATLAGMVMFTWISLTGLKHIRFEALEKYESVLLGCLLIVLGCAVVVFER